MKIAICSSGAECRESLIKSFMKQWPMYAAPAQDIFNTDEYEESLNTDLQASREKMNEAEKILFDKLIFFEAQMKKYKDVGYIIYNGCSVDILVEALILCEKEIVSEEFVEKIIYHNKKILRDLDVVYFLPNPKVTEKSSVDDICVENVYWNFYENFQTEFDTSPFFDHKNCASIILLETENPLNEIKMLLDKNGNLYGTSQGGSDGSLIDMQRLENLLKGNPQLLEAAVQSMKSGNAPNTGSITL